MNHLNLSMTLVIFILFTACKQEPKTEQLGLKRTSNSVTALLPTDPGNLIPILYRTIPEVQVISQAYNYIIDYDEKTEKFVPTLIKEVPELETLEDGNPKGKYSYTLEFLEEATWTDGSPLTANDFLFTIKLIFNPLIDAAGRYYPYFNDKFTSIEVDPDNPKVVRLYFDELQFNVLENLTNSIPIMPAYLLDPKGLMEDISVADLQEINRQLDKDEEKTLAAIEDGPIGQIAAQFVDPTFTNDLKNLQGSGAYEVTEWVPGQRIALKRKTNWWGDKVDTEKYLYLRAYPDEIIYKPVSSQVTAAASIKSEEIDAFYSIPGPDFEDLKKDDNVSKAYQEGSIPSKVWYYISINMDNPKLSEKAVRLALAKCLNVDQILSEVYLGYGQRLANPVHPTQGYYNSDLKPHERNVEEAKKILADAGWEDSNSNGILDKTVEGELVELSFEYTISGSESSRNAALLAQNSVKEAGMDLQINPDRANYFKKWRSKDYELISVGSSISPNWNPAQSWHSQLGDNRTGFGDEESDAIIEEIMVTLDEKKRIQLYKDLQAKIYDEVVVITLFAPLTNIVVHERFNYEPQGTYPCYDPKFFKLKEEYKNL